MQAGVLVAQLDAQVVVVEPGSQAPGAAVPPEPLLLGDPAAAFAPALPFAPAAPLVPAVPLVAPRWLEAPAAPVPAAFVLVEPAAPPLGLPFALPGLCADVFAPALHAALADINATGSHDVLLRCIAGPSQSSPQSLARGVPPTVGDARPLARVMKRTACS
jgi:hypothetical protein